MNEDKNRLYQIYEKFCKERKNKILNQEISKNQFSYEFRYEIKNQKLIFENFKNPKIGQQDQGHRPPETILGDFCSYIVKQDDYEQDYRNNNSLKLIKDFPLNIEFSKCEFRDIDFSSFEDTISAGSLGIIARRGDKNKKIPFKVTFIDCTFENSISLDGDKNQYILLKGTTTLKNTARLVLSNINIENDFIIEGYGNKIENFRRISCIDLSKAKLIIKNSIMYGLYTKEKELKISNVKWNSNPKKYHCTTDNFRELKILMQENQNYLDASLFHSLEMNKYSKELKWNTFNKKLLFVLNRALSNHSLSWTRPLGWLLGWSFLCFFITYFSWDRFEELSWLNWSDRFVKSLNLFVEYINPFNKNYQLKNELKGYMWLWIVHKIVSMPLIYLLTVALKRYIKF